MNAPTEPRHEPDARYYAIKRDGVIVALVNARQKAQAVSHYVSATIVATLPTQDELLALGANPVPIMDALAYARQGGE